MDPIQQLALMYAVNTGLGALGGKRGSRLFKDSFKDTAMQAALIKAGGGFQGGQTPPTSTNMVSNEQLMRQATLPSQVVEKESFLDKTKSGLESFSDVFRYQKGSNEGTMDPTKVGIGIAGAAGTAYGLGAFDPVKPPEPKYPGYNLFYAQNPGQFMLYDDPNMEIDYSQYPDKPYSGIKAGGIMSLEDGGQVSPDLLRQEYEKYKSEKESAGEEPLNFEQFKQFRMTFGPMKEGGITKLMAGGRATNMPVESIAEGTQEEMDMIPPPMSSLTPMMMAKDGALVDKLPSKTNTDENNESNYKRTSGKLVVDAAGKGNEEKDTMLAQLADGEFVTKSKAVRGAGIALGANPNDKKQQRELGARFFYKQMADLDKLAKRMS